MLPRTWPEWLLHIYDFVAILVICIFGYGVQVGLNFIRGKVIERNKTIVYFFINLSVAYFINLTMKQLKLDEWIWLGVWLFSANSTWVLDTLGDKVKKTVEIAVPAVIQSWIDKLKAPKSKEK